MDKEIKKCLQSFLNSSYDNKLAEIGNAYRMLLPKLRQLDEKNDGLLLLATILSTAAAADGKLAEKEKRTITAIFQIEQINLSDREVTNLITNSAKNDGYNKVKALIKELDFHEKVALVTLIAAVAAIDDTLDSGELAFIDELLKEQ